MTSYSRNFAALEAAERASLACKTLIYLCVGLGCLSFWAEAFAAQKFLGFVVAGMLSAASWSVSTLLSGALIRFADARQDHPVTAAMAFGLGGVLILIETGLSFHGLTWVDQRFEIAETGWLIATSAGLSIFNVGALYCYSRELTRPTTAQVVTFNLPATGAVAAPTEAEIEHARQAAAMNLMERYLSSKTTLAETALLSADPEQRKTAEVLSLVGKKMEKGLKRMERQAQRKKA